ncbi:hypothetical protein DFS34DRAFT_621124 [Phlyctochytrium arcticum]|nr:hypothetical protein DFS34DRAFT_621124 [Phlyctochytrium arcticum]
MLFRVCNRAVASRRTVSLLRGYATPSGPVTPPAGTPLAGQRVATGTAAGAAAAAGPTAAGPKPSGGSGKLVALVALTGAIGGAYYYSQQGENLVKKVAPSSTPVPALDGQNFKAFKLEKIFDVNHNTKKYRFALPDHATELGLPTTSCVVTKFVDGTKPDGKPNVVIRPYTPIEDPADGYTGHFDMVIKKYPNGPMSTHIHSMKVGDTLDIKGPIKKFEYKANEFSNIGLLAGGTGITPMIQLIQRILSNPEDKTKMQLVFANIAEEDILMRDYFDSLAKQHPGQFQVTYFLEKPPRGWTGSTGYVDESIIKKVCPKPGAGKVFICGPNQMLGAISGTKAPDFSQGSIGGILKKLGYKEGDIFKF